MRFASIVLTVACSFLVGCDYLNHTQYRVASAATFPADRARVRAVLREVAAKTKLTAASAPATVRHPLAYYTQPAGPYSRTELGAQGEGSDVLVDLDAGFGPRVPAYERTRRLLTAAVTRAFGPRVTERIGH